MKKILIFIVLAIVALLGALFIFKDTVLKISVEQAVSLVTGFPTKVDSIRYSFPETIHVQGLKIKNPAGFEKEIFTDIPEIYINISLQEILKKERIHIREMRLNLQEVNVERNREGVTNLQKLASIGQTAGGKPAQTTAKPAPSKPEPALPFQLDKFVLTMRRVSFHNQGGVLPGVPVGGTSVDLNVQGQVFNNINDPLVLVNLVVMKIVYGTTFGKLAGIDPKALLGNGLQGTFQTGEQLFSQTKGLVTEQFGTLKATAGNYVPSPEVTTEKVTGAVSGVLNEGASGVSSVFGKLKSTAQKAASEVSSAASSESK